MPDFRYFLRVRYGECDAQRVVFNPRYGEYVDLAITEFLKVLGFEAGLLTGEFDFQTVRQVTEWKAPARYDDVLEATVRCERIGTTSFVLSIVFRVAGSEKILCQCETVYVVVDHSLTKRPVSDELRERLTRGAPGQVVDHAGWGKA